MKHILFNDESDHQHHEVSTVDLGKGYQCPVKYEGDKTYNAPGTCPDCNMHLSTVK